MRIRTGARRWLRQGATLPLPMLVTMLLAACAGLGAGGHARLPIDDLLRPPGFEVGLFAIVPGAHSLATASGGTVYVGTRQGEVVRLRDDDRDGIADRAERELAGLDPPVGVAVGPDDVLFVAERDGVLRLDPEDGLEPVLPEGVLPEPSPGRLRPLAVGDDGRFYLALAPVCRSCPTRGLAGTIVRFRPDGHQLEVVIRDVDASGLGWQPRTRALVFADRAPDSIPAAPGIGALFHLPDAPETTLVAAPGRVAWNGDDLRFDEVEPALSWTFEPGSSPEEMSFYRGTGFPSRLRNGLMVALGPAQHTSPLTAPPIDPKIVAVRFDRDGAPAGEEVLLEGWTDGSGRPWGRPVDLAELEDGSVLIADELAGVVYRLSYRP